MNVYILSNNFGIICDAHHHEVVMWVNVKIDIPICSLEMCDAGHSYKSILSKCSETQHDSHNDAQTVALDTGLGMMSTSVCGTVRRTCLLM